MYDDDQVTPIGITDWRNVRKPFGIKNKDRSGHIYVIGKTGTGKSTLLLNMAISDIKQNHGFAVFDPHGDLSDEILKHVTAERRKDLIYVDPSDATHSIAFNPIYNIPGEYHHLVASGLISTFKRIWADSWGPRMEYILRMTLLTLLEYKEATLLDIQPLLTDKAYRDLILYKVTNTHLLVFWHNEFDKYPPSFRQEAISPVLNKMGLFATCLPLKNIVSQKNRDFKMQEIMDKGKILILNLSKGKLGEDVCSLLGSMILTSIQLAALHRAKQKTRRRFYVFVDEMHSFVSLSFIDILSEARKYGLCLFLAHQYIEQLPEKIRKAIFGNVGTIISFRVGAEDAEVLAKEFQPIFNEFDLVHLPRFAMYLKLMIDGATSRPFSAKTHLGSANSTRITS